MVFIINMFKITPSYLKYPLAGLALTGALFYPVKSHAQSETNALETSSAMITTLPVDVFERNSGVTPSGTSDPEVLSKAPSPNVRVQGQAKIAKFVVDLSNNILFEYDEIGNTQKAYLIASGKRSTPTHTGVRVVSHVETYPYRSAPRSSKRRRHPRDYGPKIIILNNLDTKTGITSEIGEFIHGNRNPDLLGQYVSHGCVRMDNEVILELASKVKRGDIVIIKK